MIIEDRLLHLRKAGFMMFVTTWVMRLSQSVLMVEIDFFSEFVGSDRSVM